MIRRISSEQIKNDPYIFWNEFIDIMVTEPCENFSEFQMDMFAVFTFDNELMNGGIVQYLTNQGSDNLDRVIQVLDARLEAYEHSSILKSIINSYNRLGITNVSSSMEFIEKSLVGYEYEFENKDIEETFERFIEKCEKDIMQITPELTVIIENYVNEHRSEFFEVN